MKKPLLILLLFASCAADTAGQSVRRALLVGVGANPAYPAAPLNAVAGVQALRSTLLEKGFEDRHIRILTDSEATRNGILEALAQWRAEVQPGDLALLHFYGHGLQIADDDGDEADRLDEAIVPFDGAWESPETHQNLIRDDELGRRVHDLRTRIGARGQVVVALDACHAGSGIRSAESSKTRADRHRLSVGDADVAPLVAFYAALPHQSALELSQEGGPHCALLTWNLCKALQRAGSETTYRGLFEEIALLIATRTRKQTPQAEGALDMRVFGEDLPPPPPYFRVQTLLDERTLLLGGGLLHGVHPGDALALYPVDTRDTQGRAPLARAVVEEAGSGMLECRAALDRPLSEAQALRSWVFVERRRLARYRLALRLEIADAARRETVRQQLSSLEALDMQSDDAAAELILRSVRGGLELRSAEDAVIWQQRGGERTETAIQSLRQALSDYLQAQFLRGLELESSPFRADFTSRIGVRGAPGSPRANKDTVFLQVVNRGATPVYYSILDIDARNRVQVLLPGAHWLPTDFRLEPGEASPLHAARFDAPGREVLKLLLTPQPVDLRSALDSGVRGGGGGGFLEALLDNLRDTGAGARGQSGGYSGKEVGVETLVLEVGG
jgi:hypothetical protein